jgi:hypothetical protein
MKTICGSAPDAVPWEPGFDAGKGESGDSFMNAARRGMLPLHCSEGQAMKHVPRQYAFLLPNTTNAVRKRILRSSHHDQSRM